MRKLAKRMAIVEHNTRHEAELKQRKAAELYVKLLKAPKANG